VAPRGRALPRSGVCRRPRPPRRSRIGGTDPADRPRPRPRRSAGAARRSPVGSRRASASATERHRAGGRTSASPRTPIAPHRPTDDRSPRGYGTTQVTVAGPHAAVGPGFPERASSEPASSPRGNPAPPPTKPPSDQQRPGSVARLLLHLVRLDDVADLDVVVVTEADTALESFADLGDVILDPAQRRDVEVLGHHDPVPDQPGRGVAPHDTTGHHAPGDVADPRGAEHFADLGGPERALLVLRLEHALERGLDLLDGGVDDRVVPDLDAFALGQLIDRAALRTDVEPDDDAAVDRGEVDVVGRDGTDASVNDLQIHLVADVDLGQGVLQGLHR